MRWGDPNNPEEPSGFIYIDCTVAYSQDYRGQVTKHPVDAGASITDHFIKENPVFTISGVISGTDLSHIPWQLLDENQQRPLNAQEQPEPVSINLQGSKLLQYVPATIGQFLGTSKPKVEFFGNQRTDLSNEIVAEDVLRGILQGLKYNPKTDRPESHIQLVELHTFDGINIRDIIYDLVITSFRTDENPDTGDALFLNLTLEQVTFALLEKTEIPKDVADAVKKKSEPVKKKTNANSTPKNCAEAQTAGDSTAPSTPADQLPADTDADKFGTD